MKKAILLSLATFMMTFSLNAQKIDLVNLKSGSIIRGHIVEIIPEGNVTINDLAGNTWVYSMSEVERIEEADELSSELKHSSPGFKSTTTIGFLAGSQNSQYIAPFSMQTSFGYLNRMGIYTGVLTGLEFLNVNHIPLQLDLHYYLKQGEVSPYAILRAGYTFPTVQNTESYSYEHFYTGGVTGSLGMGLKILSRDNFSWNFGVMYRYMQINHTERYDYYEQEYVNQDIYNRLEIRLGVSLDL